MFKRDVATVAEAPALYTATRKSPFRRELGFYTVDTDEHFPASPRMVSRSASDRHGYPQDLVNMPGVPLALFAEQYAPLLLNGRTYDPSKEEIEKQMTHVFVDIKNPTERVTVEKVADQNAAVLFIDSRHAPCLKMLNRVRNALDKLETNSQISTKGIKVYAFNVRNHQDIWEKIRNDYRLWHNGVELDVLSLPQIVYFFQRRRVPAVRKNITSLDSDQIAHDISQHFRLSTSPTSRARAPTRSCPTLPRWTRRTTSTSTTSAGLRVAPGRSVWPGSSASPDHHGQHPAGRGACSNLCRRRR